MVDGYLIHTVIAQHQMSNTCKIHIKKRDYFSMLLYCQIKLLWEKEVSFLSWVSLLRCLTSLYFTLLLSPGSCTQISFAAASYLVPKARMPGRPPSLSRWDQRAHPHPCLVENVIVTLKCLCSCANQEPRMDYLGT